MHTTTTQPTNGINSTMPGNASPKTIYTIFLLDLCRQVFNMASVGDKESLEHATGALISFIPNKNVREILMNNYVARRDARDGNVFMASSLTVGDAVDYLTSALSLDEQFTLGMV